jgi:arylsulfatase A-like enzyme
MNRRQFLKTMGVWTALGATSAWARKPAGPNLLIIQTDEHNFRTLGCYRKTLPDKQALVWGKDAVVTTPHIDWLADNGALCTKFYATTPVCSPSRAAFVSGRYPQNTPVTTNNIPLDDGIISFAEILRRQGYATGYAGKWHIDGDGKPQWAPKRQFGFADNRYMYNRGHWKQLEDSAQGPRVKARNAKGQPNYDVKGADEKSFTTDFLADKTVDFIKAHKDQPFCYMVSIPDPHGPNTVRAPYDTMFSHLTIKKPHTFDKAAESTPGWGAKQKKNFAGAYIQKYFGMVKCIDDNVGKILDCLRQNNTLDNTIVVFTADHGDMCGEHGRDNKGVPYESSAKIPFVLYYKGKVQPGTLIREALGCVDFLPTVLSMMGVKTQGTEQGRDASSLFTTGRAPQGWKDISFLRGTGSKGSVSWLAAVTARYKLVVSPQDRPWLFDLQADPDELNNVVLKPQYRDTLRFLAKDLLAYGEKHNDHYIHNPKMNADLKWAAYGDGPPPVVPARRANAVRNQSKKNANKRKKK